MSTIKADTLVASDGTSPATLTGQSAAKAWVNWNGTGTVAIRDSFNVGSMTDNGTGDYTTNISSAMGNANYSYVALGGDTSGALSVRIENASNRTTTTIDLLAYAGAGGGATNTLDMQDLNGVFHGDLA